MSLLTRLFRRKQPKEVAPKDYWADCSDSFYVHDYREKLDSLAEELQKNATGKIYTRFNQKKKAAEIMGEEFILAQVKVHGSEGSPFRAVAYINPFLKPEFFQEKLREIFNGLPLEFLRGHI